MSTMSNPADSTPASLHNAAHRTPHTTAPVDTPTQHTAPWQQVRSPHNSQPVHIISYHCTGLPP